MRFAQNIKISNCDFIFTNQGVAIGGDIDLTIYTTTSCNVLLDNCRFTIASGSVLTDNFRAILITAGQADVHNIQISNCFFGAGFDTGVYMLNGGNVTISNCFFDATDAVSLSGIVGFDADVSIVDCDFGASNTRQWITRSNNVNTSLYWAGQIDSAKYAFSNLGAASYYKSDITVYGTAADPNVGAVPVMPGDTYKLKDQPVFGLVGDPVMWIGSRVLGPPFYNWVKVVRA